MSLCIMCRNCCGKCAWSKWFLPVKGWTAIETYKANGDLNRAWVGWCPQFKADAGLYDIIVHGDPQEGRLYVTRQYGYITRLRYIDIRYHLVNDYERTGHDNKTIIQGGVQKMRQTDAEVKRKMLDTEPQAVEVRQRLQELHMLHCER